MSKRANPIFPFKRIQSGYMSVVFLCLAAMLICGRAKADPIGEVLIGGNTWREAQWGTSNTDDQIVLDTVDNTIHIIWTYSPPPPWANFRISRYNSYTPTNGWSYADTGLELFPEYHAHTQHTLMSVDTIGGPEDLEIGIRDFVYGGKIRAWWENDSVQWSTIDTSLGAEYVLMASSKNGRVHMLCFSWATHNYLFHNSYTIDPFSVSGWVALDTLTGFSYALACSPNSQRTAIAYFRQKNFAGQPWEMADQDVYFRSSPDGIQWDQKINITDFTYLDVFRPAIHNEVVFDYNDVAHVAFLTEEVTLTPDSILDVNPNMSFIWHWSEATDSFTVAAYGWIRDAPGYGLGSLRHPVNAPQMAINPRDGYIYLLYEAYNYDDMSLNLWPNAEQWVTVSTDGGLNWAVATNVTDSQTPGCLPGDCASEMMASMSELVNDTLHIFYILDKDAGIYWWNEGSLVEAKVVYQKIPADLIPTTPLLPQFSIRQGPVRCHYWPGDINADSLRGGVDVVYAVNYFKGFGPAPTVDCDCQGISRPFFAAGDVNGNCQFNGVDVTYYVGYLKGYHAHLKHCESCPPDAL